MAKSGQPQSDGTDAVSSDPGYCCDYDAETMRKALAATVKGEAAKKRDQLFGKDADAFLTLYPAATDSEAAEMGLTASREGMVERGARN